jgi:hypothetical protein
MHAVFIRQLSHGHFFTDRFKRNLGLEIPLSSFPRKRLPGSGRMVLSFRHFGSSFSLVDPS